MMIWILILALAQPVPANATARPVERARQPEVLYNEGCEALKAGDLTTAIERFRNAADADSPIAASARFNLGHALLRLAQQPPAPAASDDPSAPAGPAQVSPRETLTLLGRSAAAFRSVLEVDPTDVEAARNTEIVRRLIRQIEQQMQQASEQQRKMQEAADQLDRLADEQQRQADQSRQTPPSQSEQRAAEQQELNERTQEALQDLTQSLGDQSEAAEAARQMQEAMNEQQEAMQDLSDRRTDRAAQDQQEAADKLRQAARTLRQAAQRQQQGQDQQQQPAQDQQSGEQSQQQTRAEPGEHKSADELLAEQILDAEQAQREARERARRLRAVPARVERDW